MILNFVDTETTGLKPERDRIIEICMILVEIDDFNGEVKRHFSPYVQRIDPMKNIDPAAQEVHGISADELIGKPRFRDIAPAVQKILQKTDLLIAHNMEFDASFLISEFDMAGLEMPNTEVFCTMDGSRFATPYGKPPSLQELCFAFNVDYDPKKAHAAQYDVEVTRDCFLKGIQTGNYNILEECVDWPI